MVKLSFLSLDIFLWNKINSRSLLLFDLKNHFFSKFVEKFSFPILFFWHLKSLKLNKMRFFILFIILWIFKKNLRFEEFSYDVWNKSWIFLKKILFFWKNKIIPKLTKLLWMKFGGLFWTIEIHLFTKFQAQDSVLQWEIINPKNRFFNTNLHVIAGKLFFMFPGLLQPP